MYERIWEGRKEGRGGEKESGRESEREYWERCYLLEMK
jgi:hypothetical protein